MTTYTETVLRFQLQRHDELPEEHKEALRARGVNPDERWSLYMSFDQEADALEAKAQEEKDAASWETFRIVDAGETQKIERTSCF